MQENKIYLLFITIIVSVLPFVGRTADYGDFDTKNIFCFGHKDKRTYFFYLGSTSRIFS